MSLEELAQEFLMIEAELSSINARTYALGGVVNKLRDKMREPFNYLVCPDKGVTRYCEFIEDETSELAHCARSAAATISRVSSAIAERNGSNESLAKRVEINNAHVSQINLFRHVI